MQDDFFDKMLKSNPMGGGMGAQHPTQNNIEFGSGSLYNKRQPGAAGGAYGTTSSPYDHIT